MKKGIIFAAGAAVGAIAGSVTTYFLVREKFANQATEVINNMEDYYHDKIQELLEDEDEELDGDDEDEDPQVDILEDEEPEAIKKYHHYKPATYTDTYNTGVFSEEKKVTAEAEKKFDAEINQRNPGVFEITEEQFEASDYQSQDLDYFFIDEDDHPGFLRMKDSKETAEDHYHRRREELISEVWTWAPDYVDQDIEYTGDFFIQNDPLETVFRVTVHMPMPA